MSEPLKLEPVLDLKAAAPLQAALLACRGQAVDIDASGVERLGGLCLQVLISAQKTWADDATHFSLAPRSAAFNESLRLFGADALLPDPGAEEMEAK